MPDNLIYVNSAEGLARVRGNATLYKRMLGMFVGSTEFAALEEALAAGDWARGADVAHAIKGMTGNLSLTAIFDASTELMLQLRQGAPDEALLAHYRAVLEETQLQVAQAIATL